MNQKKKDRHLDGTLLSLVQNFEIKEQSELQKHLEERGYKVPQATLSRRLKQLKVVKVSGVYQIVDYDQPHLPLVLRMQCSDTGMIVLHTHPGNANSLAIYLDKKYVLGPIKEQKTALILGTIAGDDTVLMIVKDRKSLEKAKELIYLDFPYLASF